MPMNLVPGVPNTDAAPNSQSVDLMVEQVSSLIGGLRDGPERTLAIHALDRAANWMNMSGVYLFRRKTFKIGTSQTETLSSNQLQVTLPTDWGWPDDGHGVFKTNDERISEIEFVDWDAFQRLKVTIADTAKGVPGWASIQSETSDVLHWYPGVDTNEVDRLEFQYVARIQKPSESSTLTLTPETQEALICGGEAFVMRLRHSTQPNIWRPFWSQFTNAISNAKGAAHRQRQAIRTNARPDEAGRVASNVYTGIEQPTAFIGI